MVIVMVTVFRRRETIAEDFLIDVLLLGSPRSPELNPLDFFPWGQLKHFELLIVIYFSTYLFFKVVLL
jgi:hypothetical protein